MATSDKPKNILNVNALDLEGKNLEPVRVPAGGDLITFLDPFEQDAEKAEALLQAIYNGQETGRLLPAVKLWLSDEDYLKFRKAFPTFRATGTVVNAVMKQYEATWGDQGEDDASAS